MSSRICFPLTKADCESETTLPITAQSRFARTFHKNLYMQPTNDISLKSFNLWGLSTFGMRAMNVELIPFVGLPFWWNSAKKHIKSSFISGQNCLMNPNEIPSGPGLLKLSQSHTASLTSYMEKDTNMHVLCCVVHVSSSPPSVQGPFWLKRYKFHFSLPNFSVFPLLPILPSARFI